MCKKIALFFKYCRDLIKLLKKVTIRPFPFKTCITNVYSNVTIHLPNT